MKISIRQSVFETNSSSTHSMTIYYKSDWAAFEKGELNLVVAKYEIDEEPENNEDAYVVNLSGELTFIKPGEKVLEGYIEIPFNRLEIREHDNLEADGTTFITKNGDELVIECRYGFDG